ncbi:MAG TPA: hypothetical protein VJT73_13490 [Polyangiaceae bacterium]|nr:hypothetical protein [Polyangiaceae bacterium]
MMADIASSCRDEVFDFHALLELWLRGTLSREDPRSVRLTGVLAGDCRFVTPGGNVESGPALGERLLRAHGSQPDLRIVIEDFAMVAGWSSAALVRYVERRVCGRQATARFSTVLFRRWLDAPSGVVWQHIHETWVAGEGI